MTAQPQVAERRSGAAKWGPVVLLLLPALVLYLLFVLAPIVEGAYYSLFNWDGMSLPPTNFIGLDNYAAVLGDDRFLTAVRNNGFVIALSLLVQIPFSLALAVYLNQHFPGRTLFRVIFFLPYVISDVIAAILFYQLLQPDGAWNALLGVLGMQGFVVDWFGELGIVMWTLFFVITWRYFGFHMIILLAGLQGIPHEIYEAALIDGANRWQAFRHVTLPLLGPTLRVSVFLSIIGALQLFDIVWATTQGGPDNVSSTMATYLYKFGFEAAQWGYGSAVAVILFVLCLIFALLYQRFVLRQDVEGAVTAYNG